MGKRPIGSENRGSSRRHSISLALLALGAALLLVPAGCGSAETPSSSIEGSGSKTAELRALPAFNSIFVSGNAIDAYVTIGSPASVLVATDANLVPLVTTRVANGQLIVALSRVVSTQLGLRADITAPALTSVKAGRAVQLHLSGLSLDKLDIYGDVGSTTSGSGTLAQASVTLVGGAKADLRALQMQDAVVSLDGAATAEVMATRLVSGEARGISHLGVWGSPEVDVKTSPGSTVTMMVAP